MADYIPLYAGTVDYPMTWFKPAIFIACGRESTRTAVERAIDLSRDKRATWDELARRAERRQDGK